MPAVAEYLAVQELVTVVTVCRLVEDRCLVSHKIVTDSFHQYGLSTVAVF